jgi:hypothetical protein
VNASRSPGRPARSAPATWKSPKASRRPATRSPAASSTADPERRLARERLIAATPALQARRLAKTVRWEQDLPTPVDESFAALAGLTG